MKFDRWRSSLAAAVTVVGMGVLAVPAAAQEEVTQHTEAVPLGSAPEEDQTLFNLSVGVTGNSGNTRAVSGNGGFNFLLKRRPHVFTLDALGTLGWANPEPSSGGDLEANARNFVGRARYDYFLSDRDALFAAFVPRRDLFAGIRARMQLQAGYARVLYQPEDAMRLWSEIGGDITIDRYEPLEQEDGTLSDPTDTEIYSVRLFLGYENMLSEAAQVRLGVEALLPPYDKRGEDDPNTPENDSQYRYRINANAELLSSLSSRFRMGASFRVLYDSSPPAGTPSKVDTVTTFLLSYTYDSLAEKEAAAEEPACPPCEGAEPEAASPEAAAAAEAEGPAAVAPAPTPADTAPVDDDVSVPAPVDEQAATEKAEEAASEVTTPVEEAVEAGEAAPPPAGTEAAPVQPPAAEE